MSEKFIIVDSNTERVINIYHLPNDPENGVPEELLDKGFMVSDPIPEAENIVGKTAVLHYGSEGFYYTYEDRPLNESEKLDILLEKQALIQQALDELVLGGM